MATGYILPTFGVLIENESAASLLPTFGPIIQTDGGGSPPAATYNHRTPGGGWGGRVICDLIRKAA